MDLLLSRPRTFEEIHDNLGTPKYIEDVESTEINLMNVLKSVWKNYGTIPLVFKFKHLYYETRINNEFLFSYC